MNKHIVRGHKTDIYFIIVSCYRAGLLIINHFLKSLKSYIVMKRDPNKYCILWGSPVPESIGRSFLRRLFGLFGLLVSLLSFSSEPPREVLNDL